MKRRHPVRVLSLAASAAVLLALSAGQARAHPLYDTTRVISQQGNACLKPANCRVIEGSRKIIRPNAAAVITMHCPAATPYFQGWDVGHHEHIRVQLLDHDRRSLKVIATNDADSNGVAKVFIGCSARNVRPTSLMQSAGGLPSKPLKRN